MKRPQAKKGAVLDRQGLEAVNARFNEELQRQIDGSLPNGHIYQLGRPGEALRSAGVEELPVEMPAGMLVVKSNPNYKSAHPFDLTDIRDLPKAINKPIAVFNSVTENNSKVILTELKDCKGNNFVVAMRISRDAGRKSKVPANRITTVFPKDKTIGIIEWINSKNNALLWADKEKALNFISAQPTSLAAGGNSAQGVNPKIIETAKTKVQNFQNP